MWNVKIINLRIQNAGVIGKCINLENGQQHIIKECDIENVVGNSSDMVYFVGSSVIIENNEFTNNESTAFTVRCRSIIGRLNINSNFINNYIAGIGKGIIIDSADVTTRVEGMKILFNTFINTGSQQVTIFSVLSLDISHNMFDQCSNSAILFTSSGLGVNGVNISDNYISTAQSPTTGIAIYSNSTTVGVAYIVISNNQIVYCGYGISLGSNFSNVNISNNLKIGNIEHAAVTLNQCKNCIVSNNYFGTVGYWISLTDGALGGLFIVKNNFINGLVLRTQTDINKFIFSCNIGYKTANKGIATLTSANTFKDVPHGLNITPNISDINVVPTNIWGVSTKYFIDNVTSATFRVNFNAAPTSDATFAWSVTD